MFDNWINSDLIYFNDILNENGEISQNLILDKLKYKNNWISEFICLKKALPNEWYHTLQAQNSIKSVVNFQKVYSKWKMYRSVTTVQHIFL